MSFWKDLEKVVTKNIPRVVTKDIPNVVTKEIPKAIPEPVKKLFRGDFTKRMEHQGELIQLREDVEGLEARLSTQRDQFAQLQQDFITKRDAYVRLTEDFVQPNDEAAEQALEPVADVDWDDPQNKTEKTLDDIQRPFRGVLDFVTFDLIEIAWAAGEARAEQEFLQKRKAALAAVAAKYATIISELNAAVTILDQGIQQVRDVFGDVANEKLIEIQNQQRHNQPLEAEQSAIASRMLANGATGEQVALVTGLDQQQIQQLLVGMPGEPLDGQVGGIGTEQHLLESAQQLIDDGLDNDDITTLTGLNAIEIDQLRAKPGPELSG